MQEGLTESDAVKYLNDINYKDCVGKILKSKNFGDFKILKYNNSRNVDIQFVTTVFETSAQLEHIKNGNVKDEVIKYVDGKYNTEYVIETYSGHFYECKPTVRQVIK